MEPRLALLALHMAVVAELLGIQEVLEAAVTTARAAQSELSGVLAATTPAQTPGTSDMKDWFVAFAAAASLLWLTLWTAHIVAQYWK